MSDSGRPSGLEPGVSEVNGPQRRVMTTKDKLLIAGIVTITALGFIWFNAALRQKAPPLARAAAVAGGGEQYTPPPNIQPAKPTDASLPMPAASAPSDSALAQKQSPETAPILAFSGGSAPASRILNAVPSLASLGGSGEAGSQPPAPTPVADGGALAQKLKPTVLSGATASVIKNPDMVVTEGTLIPCILQTAIDTQLAGFVTCVVPIDVRGTSGNVVLLDRGTKIVGQIQAGLVQGQERVFVLWTRAETPKHVVISLNAPGADELGRSGLPGAVDNHWWQRFGGALKYHQHPADLAEKPRRHRQRVRRPGFGFRQRVRPSDFQQCPPVKPPRSSHTLCDRWPNGSTIHKPKNYVSTGPKRPSFGKRVIFAARRSRFPWLIWKILQHSRAR
jgi:type IV secretion system protein VirB10